MKEREGGVCVLPPPSRARPGAPGTGTAARHPHLPSPLNFSRVKKPENEALAKGRRTEAAEVGGRERSHTFLTSDNEENPRRLDHFKGVTYVNEVIAINSPLCGSP